MGYNPENGSGVRINSRFSMLTHHPVRRGTSWEYDSVPPIVGAYDNNVKSFSGIDAVYSLYLENQYAYGYRDTNYATYPNLL